MNKLLSLLLIIGLASCTAKKAAVTDNATTVVTEPTKKLVEDNQELAEIYKTDQSDRRVDKIDWKVVSKKDSIREVRVHELLEANEVQTASDYHHAAMVFQHGGDSTAYGMAVRLMKKSLQLDPTRSKWLLAATTDRYLMSKGEPQIYGTQYQKRGRDKPWVLGEMDSTQVTDAERIEYGVETLAQQREKVKRMNLKKITEVYNEEKDIDKFITFLNTEVKSKKSKYNVSESAINSFGYQLLRAKESEKALKIFKLNTELYPKGYNTHDSYGECLLLLGRKEEGITAYKKSLELNPKNDHARKVIEKHK